VITLDTALQRSAQSLLDQAVARRLPSGNRQLDTAAGGAVIAIDVRNGALLAAASAPRFDPNVFTQDGSTLIAGWLTDPSRPLFDRTVQMALPPGSVFKIVSAAAIVASGVDPRAPVDCQGYLHQPDALRCAIYRRYGIGHGPVTLIDALARSCNVYFFQHAEQLGPAPILDWARRFGLGAVTGVDLPGEAAGRLPVVNDVAPDVARQTRTDALPIAIGQSTTTTTPLQIVRIAAAIANGGKLVRPHVAQRIALSPEEEESKSQRVEKSKSLFDTATFRRFDPPRPIVGLDERMVSAIRDGMRQAVADEQGTAHATVDLAAVSIAGKTGTAETGPGKPEHAWFVGYAPADQPRVAFVVVIEHAGNADTAAGPVAQHFVERLSQLGYFSRTKR
jgi:penicillin-binding protein 2